MSLPTPPVALDGQCTVIYNDTLYSFQSNAFQSIPLTQGAKWSQLPMGVPVSNAVCVRATNDGKDALFIVGGTTDSPALQNYTGFQWYTFEDQQWGNYTSQFSVTRNRKMHGAAWLNSTSSILVYAGFQNDDWVDSSATFTISTLDPYTMQAYSSSAPPAMSPIVLPYNSSHAVMVGGSPENQEVWTFSEADGWHQLDNVTLPMGLPNTSYVQGGLYNAADGSKYLQLFNMSASPNTVRSIELKAPANASISKRNTKSSHSSWYSTKRPRPSRKRRRDPPLGSYPAYNGSLASTTTRDGFSIAQDASGLVIIAGGVSPSSADPLCVFNQTSDAWINANQIFVSATPTPSPTSTLAPSSSPSMNIAAVAGGRNQSTVIVGSVLGAVFGFVLFCVLIIFGLKCLRRRDRRRRPASGKGEMDFTDRGAEFMASAGGSFSSSNHGAAFFAQTTTSAGVTGESQKPKHGFFHKPGDSNGSSRSIFARNKSPVIPSQAEPMIPITSPDRPAAATPSPEPRTQPRTDEGWSTYFQNNQDPTDLTQLPPDHTRYQIPSRDTQYTTTSQSDYTSSDSRVVSSQPHASAEVPPLNVRGTFSHIAEDDEYMEESSSGQDSWTPVATSDKGSSWGDRPTGDRPPSSIYGDTGTYPHPGTRVRIPNFPVVPTSNRTSQHTVVPINSEERGLRTLASKDFAGGLTTPASRRSPEEGTRSSAAGPSFESPRTKLSPRPAGDASGAHRGLRNEQDTSLSWLNLNGR